MTEIKNIYRFADVDRALCSECGFPVANLHCEGNRKTRSTCGCPLITETTWKHSNSWDCGSPEEKEEKKRLLKISTDKDRIDEIAEEMAELKKELEGLSE